MSLLANKHTVHASKERMQIILINEGKQKTKFSDESDENCAICYKGYVEGEDWIQCDICSLWYHRFCVNLEDGDEKVICGRLEFCSNIYVSLG
jgi:hypothetical protein